MPSRTVNVGSAAKANTKPAPAGKSKPVAPAVEQPQPQPTDDTNATSNDPEVERKQLHARRVAILEKARAEKKRLMDARRNVSDAIVEEQEDNEQHGDTSAITPTDSGHNDVDVPVDASVVDSVPGYGDTAMDVPAILDMAADQIRKVSQRKRKREGGEGARRVRRRSNDAHSNEGTPAESERKSADESAKSPHSGGIISFVLDKGSDTLKLFLATGVASLLYVIVESTRDRLFPGPKPGELIVQDFIIK